MRIKHIFNTNQDCTQIDLKSCIPVSLNMSKVSTVPFVSLSIKEFFMEHLGKKLYNWLADGYVKSTQVNGVRQFETSYKDEEAELWQELICCARCTIAWYAYFKMLGSLGVQLSDSGITQQESDQAMRPEKYMYDNTYWDAFNNAMGEMERTIFDCLCPKADLYAQYGFDVKKWCCPFIIPTPKIFSEHQVLDQRGRFYTWLKLIPFIKKVEKIHIKPMLCSLFPELKKCDTYEDDTWAELQECVRDLIADLTIQMAMPSLNLQAKGTGFKVLSGHSSSRKTEKATYLEVQHLNHKIEMLSPKYYKVLISHLQANPESFGDWVNSDCNPAFVSEESKNCGCGYCKHCLQKKQGGNLLTTDGNIIAI